MYRDLLCWDHTKHTGIWLDLDRARMGGRELASGRIGPTGTAERLVSGGG
jgi:hypothetical protein